MADKIKKEELLEDSKPAVKAKVEKEVKVEESKPKAKKETKKAPEKKAPGRYYKGKLIEAIPARLGRFWTVIIEGERVKIPKSEIEIVK
jgi:hypothetical protein